MEIYHREARAFHELLEIFQNVSRNFSKLKELKNNQHLLFVLKVAQKLKKKTKQNKKITFVDLMLKYASDTAKVRFLSPIFVQFCCVTSVAL